CTSSRRPMCPELNEQAQLPAIGPSRPEAVLGVSRYGRLALIPVTEPSAATLTIDADCCDEACFHHCVAKPEAPHPIENFTRYCPGSSPISEYLPSPPETPMTGFSVCPKSGSGVALTGKAVTHSPATGWPRWVTDPEIAPLPPSLALMPAVVEPAVTLTSVAVASDVWPLYHCGA